MFHHAPVLVLASGIGIGVGQYYWVLGALFGIVLTLIVTYPYHIPPSAVISNKDVKRLSINR